MQTKCNISQKLGSDSHFSNSILNQDWYNMYMTKNAKETKNAKNTNAFFSTISQKKEKEVFAF